MSDWIRSNWFVVVVIVALAGATGYFIYDANRNNVPGRQADGKDVIASLAERDITADELYDQGAPFDGQLLYNLYKNAVVSQSVQTTSNLEKEAKEMEKTIDQNVRGQSSDKYKEAFSAELASYGFASYDDLYDYCLVNVKEKELDRTYVDAHFEELKESLKDKQPRTVSQIKVTVSNPESLTEDEQKKVDSIDKALESGTFADAATAFSDDTATADKEGFAGYIDADDAAQGNGVVAAEAVSAALSLKKGETTDWISVTDASTGAKSMVKVTVDEDDVTAIHESDNEDVRDELLYALLGSDTGLSMKIMQEAASKLKITFEDEQTQARLDNYMKTAGGQADAE